MTDPNAHVPMGTITDREGRRIITQFDFGDFLFGIYRLTEENRKELRVLLDEADAKTAVYRAQVAAEAAADFTVDAIRAVLAAAGFAEYDGDQFGFTVAKAAFGSEISVDLRGVNLLPFNPGTGLRALLDDYATALTAVGYRVRTPGSMVIVSESMEG